MILALLAIGHYAADGLQTSFMAKYKAPGSMSGWFHVLMMHTAIHAIAVIAALLAFGYGIHTAIIFGCVEMVLHSIIDICKSEKLFGLNIDQSLHLACKLLYTIVLVSPSISVLRFTVLVSVCV